MNTKLQYASLIALMGYVDAGLIMTSVINMVTWERYLSISDSQMDIISLLTFNTLGSGIGAFIGGICADKWGRKRIFLYNAWLYIVGIMLITSTTSFNQLMVGFVITSLAIGVTYSVGRTMVMEYATPNKRRDHASLIIINLCVGSIVAVILESACINLGIVGQRLIYLHYILIVGLIAFYLRKMPDSTFRLGYSRTTSITLVQFVKSSNTYTALLYLFCTYSIWAIASYTLLYAIPSRIFSGDGTFSDIGVLYIVITCLVGVLSTCYIFRQVKQVSKAQNSCYTYFAASGLFGLVWFINTLNINDITLLLVFVYMLSVGINYGTGQQAFYQMWVVQLFPTRFRCTMRGFLSLLTRTATTIWILVLDVSNTELAIYACLIMAIISCLVGTLWYPRYFGMSLRNIENIRYPTKP